MLGVKVEKVIVWVAVMLSVVMTGCGSLRHSNGGRTAQLSPPGTTRTDRTSTSAVEVPAKAQPSMSALLTEANSWLGTPYKYGGNTRDGVDCSGFVLQVYLRALDISLPRTSAQQQEFSRKIRRDEMKPGDLMFFSVREGGNVGHVGIYIGDDKMIHASSKVGVVVASVTTDYFKRNYLGSGRIEAYAKRLASESKPPAPPVDTPRDNTPKPTPAPAPVEPVRPQPQTQSQPQPARQPIKTVRVSPQAQPAADIDEDFFD
ncbi:MAG: C40 family peptidase [Paramuribaculum sp.]|nr:C40 family peptidase [Paramuribaculum sp.]